VAAGGVACEEFKSRKKVAVSLLSSAVASNSENKLKVGG